MALMQQMMQVATQPSPVKAVFSKDDVELAAVVLIQHLIASCSADDVRRPVDLSCPPPASDHDDVGRHHTAASDAAVTSSLATAAAAASTTVANDDDSKQAVPGRSQRRRRTCAAPVRGAPAPAVSQLMEMGFARRKAEAAVKQLGMTVCLVVKSTLFEVLHSRCSGSNHSLVSDVELRTRTCYSHSK